MLDGRYDGLGDISRDRRYEAVKSEDLDVEGGVGRGECLGLKKTSESGEVHFYFPIPLCQLASKIAKGAANKTICKEISLLTLPDVNLITSQPNFNPLSLFRLQRLPELQRIIQQCLALEQFLSVRVIISDRRFLLFLPRGGSRLFGFLFGFLGLFSSFFAISFLFGGCNSDETMVLVCSLRN